MNEGNFKTLLLIIFDCNSLRLDLEGKMYAVDSNSKTKVSEIIILNLRMIMHVRINNFCIEY